MDLTQWFVPDRTDWVRDGQAGVQPGALAPELPAIPTAREWFGSHQTRADFSATAPSAAQLLWMPFNPDPQNDELVSNLQFPTPMLLPVPTLGLCIPNTPGHLTSSPTYAYWCPVHFCHVPVKQNDSPVPVSNNRNVAPATSQWAAKTQGEQLEGVWPQSTEEGGRQLEQDGPELQESAERSMVRQEDCTNTPVVLCPEIEEHKDEDAPETEVTGNDSFLDYLDELCSNDNFVNNVESILDTDFLNSILSGDLDPLNLFDLEK